MHSSSTGTLLGVRLLVIHPLSVFPSNSSIHPWRLSFGVRVLSTCAGNGRRAVPLPAGERSTIEMQSAIMIFSNCDNRYLVGICFCSCDGLTGSPIVGTIARGAMERPKRLNQE